MSITTYFNYLSLHIYSPVPVPVSVSELSPLLSPSVLELSLLSSLPLSTDAALPIVMVTLSLFLTVEPLGRDWVIIFPTKFLSVTSWYSVVTVTQALLAQLVTASSVDKYQSGKVISFKTVKIISSPDLTSLPSSSDWEITRFCPITPQVVESGSIS